MATKKKGHGQNERYASDVFVPVGALSKGSGLFRRGHNFDLARLLSCLLAAASSFSASQAKILSTTIFWWALSL